MKELFEDLGVALVQAVFTVGMAGLFFLSMQIVSI